MRRHDDVLMYFWVNGIKGGIAPKMLKGRFLFAPTVHYITDACIHIPPLCERGVAGGFAKGGCSTRNA